MKEQGDLAMNYWVWRKDNRHCEEQSDVAIQKFISFTEAGLLPATQARGHNDEKLIINQKRGIKSCQALQKN